MESQTTEITQLNFRLGSEGNHDQLLALNIFTDTADVFETANALFSQYSNFVSNNLTQFRENLKTKLNAATLLGETLTTNFPDFLSTIINIGGDHFNEYLPGGGTLASDVFIDIGDGDDVSKHNFSIHNLVISTHDADKSFGELLKNNDLVRRAFLDKGGIIGPISHAREGVTSSGPDRDQSALTVGLVDTSIVNRALFNSYFEQDGAENKAMYNYFHSLFTEHLFDGAVGQGKELPATSITIHSGVTKLALGILRDATQSTGKLEEIEENIEQRTGFENFAFAGDKFGSSDGMVIIDQNGFLDELPLGVLDADERRAEQLEFGVQQFGIRDVNFHVFKRAAAGLGIQVTTNISQPESVIGPLTDAARFFGTDFIGVNYTANYEDDNLYGKQKWEVLVAQAGSDDGGLEFNVAGENGENTEAAQRAHLIIGGEGQNIITGGLSDDILVGGDGTGLAGNSGDVFANSFVWTGGNDVFIGGKSTDKYTFTGTHTSVPNADSPSGDFVQGNLFLAGDGIDVADYSRELLSNLVFEVCWSCGDLTGLRFFNSVFEPDACDDFWEVLEAS